MQTYSDLEISILHHNETIIRDEFKIEAAEFFHYTNAYAAGAILNDQSFHSPLIRCSSDPLEFASPMAACRDWVCLSNKFLAYAKFPDRLFMHFNEEATDPSARAYFISLSSNPDSEHLKSIYGDSRLKIDLNTDKTDFKSYGYFVGCKYVDDTKTEVFRLLDRWRDEAFDRAIVEHKVKDPMQNMVVWFYTMIQFCNTISVGIKQKAFAPEGETRIVVVPPTPDKEAHWHLPRRTKSTSSKSLIQREYLPLKLNPMGIVITQ